MSRKADFRRLFREAFRADAAWTDWFVEKVYDDRDALFLDVDGKAVSALLMNRYDMSFHGTSLPVAYISCVATARAERGKGMMHRLMARAITEAAGRGAAIAALIPATRFLYFFYDAFGFATVFYVDELRYTALHTFRAPDEYAEVTPSYDMLARLEAMRACAVRHSAAQYEHIITDIAFDGGIVAAVENADGDCAMAFAVPSDENILVLDLPASSPEAAEAALARVRDFAGEKPIVVRALPGEVPPAMRARGMARIIDLEAVLSAVAQADPSMHQHIRVSDPLIPANNGIFSLAKGECRRVDKAARLDLDVTVDTLARILFSAPATGEIFNLPAARPFISLMLD